MGRRRQLTVLFCFFLFSLSLPFVTAQLNDFFTFRMNFPVDESRSHLQTVTYTGTNLSATIPSGFSAENITGGGTISGSVINWSNGTGRAVNYTLVSPSACNESAIFASNLSVNDTFSGAFTFVCLPDSKIVDYKAEYGHGDANYLSERYIPNDSVTLFNLIRVFPIGQYFTPNLNTNNVSINCSFPRNFTVRTYGRVGLVYNNTAIQGNFFWEEIVGGYWFRLGVVSHDLKPEALPVGSFYNVTCDPAILNYDHHRAVAPFGTAALEVRTKTPFNITVDEFSDRFVYNITHVEKYSIKSVFFEWSAGGSHFLRELPSLYPGETVQYEVFLTGAGNISLNAYFIPSWYANSRNPSVLNQSNTTEFSISGGTGRIVDVDFGEINNLNVSTTVPLQPSIEVIDVAIVPMNKTYRTKIIVHNHTGALMNASTLPQITIFDPNRTIIVNTSAMTSNGTGIYIFNTTFNFSEIAGLWESVFVVNVSGDIRQTADFWTLSSSPALVKIQKMVDTVVPDVTCEYNVTNEGGFGQEYQIRTCLTTDPLTACVNGSFFEQFAKFLNPTDVFITNRTFPLVTQGRYFCRVEAFFGSIVSTAVLEFDATLPPLAGGGGGGGRAGPRVSPNMTNVTPIMRPVPQKPLPVSPTPEVPQPTPPVLASPGTLFLGPLAIPPISFTLFLAVSVIAVILTLLYLLFSDEIEWLFCIFWCKRAHKSHCHEHRSVGHVHQQKGRCHCHCCFMLRYKRQQKKLRR